MTKLPLINPEVCSGCAECLDTCPLNGLVIQDGIAAVRDTDTCCECPTCSAECSHGAIRYMVLA